MTKSSHIGTRPKKDNKKKRTKDLYGRYTQKGIRRISMLKETSIVTTHGKNQPNHQSKNK